MTMDTEARGLITEDQQEPGPPPEEELVVMRLVVEGLTDQAIARRIGVSIITVRRRAVRFRRRLGASTRIEAAVLATKRGWL